MKRFLLLLSIALFALFSYSSAQSCASYAFTNNAKYASCSDLPYLSSYLHWNYDSATRQLDTAYRHTGVTASNWVAWAINPTGTTMTGAQALVAYQYANGSMRAYTSPITDYSTTMEEGALSFTVPNISAEFVNGEMIIFATIDLPASLSTTLNLVWQDGPLSSDAPSRHATTGENMQSMVSTDLLSGSTTGAGGGATGSRLRRRNTHGVLNAVSWGVLMPMGVMAARYLKVFKSANPAWFYIHIACQSSAYIVGVAGWATGLKLSDESGITRNPHKNIGITLFVLGTLQVFALLLRPKPDHKYRLYWNIYHHATGYTVIILSIVNIFKGFDILQPDDKWKRAYIGILIALGAIALVLEAVTWVIVINRKKKDSSDKFHTSNGANGYENGRHSHA